MYSEGLADLVWWGSRPQLRRDEHDHRGRHPPACRPEHSRADHECVDQRLFSGRSQVRLLGVAPVDPVAQQFGTVSQKFKLANH